MSEGPSKGRGRGRLLVRKSVSPLRKKSDSEDSWSSPSPPIDRKKKSPSKFEDAAEVTDPKMVDKLTQLTVEEQEEARKKLELKRGGIPTRAVHRGLSIYRQKDIVVTRPANLETKIGKEGKPVNLVTNYFQMKKGTSWALHKYVVSFTPDVDDKRTRKFLVREKFSMLGAYIFDGFQILTPNVLDFNKFEGKTKEEEAITVCLEENEEMVPGDYNYLTFYGILIRKCMQGMNLEELGRGYYDSTAAINVESARLTLWPGYNTVVRNHEQEILLCVEISHKVLRNDSVHTVIKGILTGGRGGSRNNVEDELLGSIVMTTYNHKTYRIDEIKWDLTPKDTFTYRDKEISYAEYAELKYKKRIEDFNQPMLLSQPRKKDIHKGIVGPIILIPELCVMTGLTDAMRANPMLMKDLGQHLHVDPSKRIESVKRFMTRLYQSKELTQELKSWGIEFSKDLVNCKGRLLDPQKIVFQNNETESAGPKADWTMAFRSKKMLSSVNLEKWIILVPERDYSSVSKMVSSLITVCKPMGFIVSQPLEIIKVSDIRPGTYTKTIDNALGKHKGNLQMCFVILPNNKPELYGKVKQKLSIEYGIPSQCFVAKNLNNKGLMSICTKMGIQMNAKLGGEPWTVESKIQNTMIVGFDVYHGSMKEGKSYGAMVSTTSKNFAKYFSVISLHENKSEISQGLAADLQRCIRAYEEVNGVLPEKIIIYRDGVGEGQLTSVFETELGSVRAIIESTYEPNPPAKLSFIVCTKKINTRYAKVSPKGISNPEPGTVLDDVVTLPERYDFYLVAQMSRQGTVSPTSYNILHDTLGITPDIIQKLTFKLCHLYYNWSGTVQVPAPCQYAHKLAYLTGLALKNKSHNNLALKLHFL